ncbi:TIGR04283 family arsenosugar biosynthesis glycosyltransferase [Clostridium botulinum]|uniref:4,4'-diaponeurosporenoate glycosyltransferase n=1 Tax=Clostridium botulinum (strain Hall / ATCC 3502 / NCTC 13319 / Type A) TaxID=441771 RepID=A5I546_CLOBH|nr:TIGR04283 family arsenosugar biosynthesis glycosyltransferase [Clostridium botulinum]EPS46898.1 glycosyl transferase family protein [Clostridium botulinum CFSAN002369]ABS35508.1 glycosyl transferase, group 2 family protein [Clostridium botulinum A str. ATCC 19397]ABS38518.1 glycosyl transferase, group 2 family [Clostridium botulinum A str. Hall]AWB18400.1 glycosyl transferase [Clostridium botulinum]AWB31174.1 glycosyl transferase [Clostridium botulinum]
MVSIIVPVLNEEKTIENLLVNLKRLKGEKEILIIDGGSKDSTTDIASQYGKVIKSKKGRSNQMNCGAKEANGNILWFVHSDSIVHYESIVAIEKAIKDGYIGGGFPIYFCDLNSLFMKYISKTSNIRADKFNIYYGDQGIFVKKDIFLNMGGYPSLDIMEDLEFSFRLRRLGKLKLLSYYIGTSGRRFKKGGQFKTHILMHKLRILYFMRVPTEKLNKIYREER